MRRQRASIAVCNPSHEHRRRALLNRKTAGGSQALALAATLSPLIPIAHRRAQDALCPRLSPVAPSTAGSWVPLVGWPGFTPKGSSVPEIRVFHVLQARFALAAPRTQWHSERAYERRDRKSVV